MKYCNLLIINFLILSCTSKQVDKEINSNKAESEKEIPVSKIQKFQVDSIIDINNFYINDNFVEFTEITNKFSEDNETQTFIAPVFTWGDCEGRYKKLFNSIGTYELYIFKSDCGEYGFSNDQFYFVNDTIIMVRNFNLQIAEWQSDTTPIRWSIIENIYLFKNNELQILNRERFAISCFDYSIKGEEFTQKQGDRIAILQEKRKEFNNLMDLVNNLGD